MDVLVLGAGVTGLCAGYALARDGHAVTIVERNPEAAREASFANGGQLSYSYVAPLAGPGVIPKIPGWLLNPESPMRFRPRLDPGQWRWGMKFLAACNPTMADLTTRRLLRLSALSRRLVHRLVEEESLAFSYDRSGKLVVLSDQGSFDGARALMDFQAKLGCTQQALDTAEVLRLEPSLARIAPRLVGGIYTPDEEAGDCRAFCLGLSDILAERYGVRFRWGTHVSQLVAQGGRLRAVMTAAGAMEADAFVLAAGAAAGALLRPLGFALPLYPLKGYSLTLPVTNPAAAPQISVTDAARKVVYARLGDRMRVAGMADLVGYDTTIRPARLDLLVREARDAFPDAADWMRIGPWTGLRPATPTSAPILGLVPGLENLALDVGQGALGFTLAMASGRIVADALAGRQAAIEMDGFQPSDHGL
ncbi:D-amino acid dehydrogenase [Humitalea sp. 24SJ18S-53]|uniref:D-amino acid dehydrogenase n=1 Tax=Humitalea sp. 24SJ18S-53 TaxID=3422307 RepID=UPI003D66AE93